MDDDDYKSFFDYISYTQNGKLPHLKNPLQIKEKTLLEIDNASKSTWKWINMLLPSILIILFGVFRFRAERKRAEYLEEIYG